MAPLTTHQADPPACLVTISRHTQIQIIRPGVVMHLLKCLFINFTGLSRYSLHLDPAYTSIHRQLGTRLLCCVNIKYNPVTQTHHCRAGEQYPCSQVPDPWCQDPWSLMLWCQNLPRMGGYSSKTRCFEKYEKQFGNLCSARNLNIRIKEEYSLLSSSPRLWRPSSIIASFLSEPPAPHLHGEINRKKLHI